MAGAFPGSGRFFPLGSAMAKRFLLDRLLLRATRGAISCEKRSYFVASTAGLSIEIWIERCPRENPESEASAFVLRFLGTRGRAELATSDPIDRLPGTPGEIWTVNPPGYGGSTGPASFATYANAALSAFDAMRAVAGDRPIWVAGKSLGSNAALHVAARRPVSGVLLRNPVPLRDFLRQARWRGLPVPLAWLASALPADLDAVANAGNSTAPAVMLTSSGDRVVSPALQRLVTDAYVGPKRVLLVPGEHDDRVLPVPDEQRYRESIRWLASKSGIPDARHAT